MRWTVNSNSPRRVRPSAIPVALLTAGGLILSVPLAVMTASPAVGRLMLRAGIGRLPEETIPPEILWALDLPALLLTDHA